MTSLSDLQQRMVDGLRSGVVPPECEDTSPLGASGRFAVYARSREARLGGVLAADFPRVRALLGSTRFFALARAYLAAHPPADGMSRNLGRSLPAFVRARLAGPEAALAGDLGRLEWAWTEAFDAPLGPTATRSDLAGFPPDAWPELSFDLAPHARWDAYEHRVDVYSADDPGRWPPAVPVRLLVWRRELRVFVRPLEDSEAAALEGLARGAPFAEICERGAGPERSVSEAADRAAGRLARWLDDELIARVHGPRSSG